MMHHGRLRMMDLFPLWVCLTLCVAGCFDMPDLEYAPGAPSSSISLGPYLLPRKDGSVELRFRTTRPTVVGLRFEDGKRLNRFGSGSTNHVIRLMDWESGQTKKCQIWLNDKPGPKLTIKKPSEKGDPVSLGFLGGLIDSTSAVTSVNRLLEDAPLDGMILTSEVLKKNDIEFWRQRFFKPFADTLGSTPLHMLPGNRRYAPLPLFPYEKAEEVVWRRQIGCVYLVALDTRTLRNVVEAKTILNWLDTALTAKPNSAVWTVVLLSEPLFTNRHVNIQALQSLGERLEKHRVHLAISGGYNGYHRTLPLIQNGRGPIRYILTSGLQQGDIDNVAREYTAYSTGLHHISLLKADEGSLEWRVFGFDGEVLDQLTLLPNRMSEDGEPPLEKNDILTDALAVSTLQREIRAIGRQLCRAVSSPSSDQDMRIYIQNPSTRRFSGRLAWSKPNPAAWIITPSEIDFDLSPGRATSVEFHMKRADPKGIVPYMLTDVEGVGYLRQALVLTKEKQATVPLVAQNVFADGRFGEALWKTSAEISDFQTFIGQGKPKRIVRCSVVAADNGLAVGLRCEAENPAKIKTRARRRDAPVHKDDSVELFLDPTGRNREFMQFSVNVRGVMLDRSSRLGISWNPDWKRGVRFGRTETGLRYYNVEILIPYQTLGLNRKPQPGEEWAFNIVRNDIQTPEVIQWAPTYGSNARSGCYGRIVFENKQ